MPSMRNNSASKPRAGRPGVVRGPEHRLRPTLSPDGRLQFLRVPISLHRDAGNRAVDVVYLIRRQLDTGGSEIFFEAMQLGRAENGHDPRLLSEQPRKRNLCGCGVPLFADLSEQIDHGLVSLARLRRETGHDVAKVRAIELGILVDGAGQEPSSQRAEGHKADPEPLEGRQDLLLGFSPPQGVLALHRIDRLHRMNSTDGLCPGFGQAEMLHLAFLNQIPHGAGHLLDRYGGVDSVLIQEINEIGLEALERSFHHLPDVLGPAVETVWLAVDDLEAKFGRDTDPPPLWSQRLAQQFFVLVRSVNLRSVKEGHAAIDRGAEQGNRLLFVSRRPVSMAQSHTAQPEG